MPRKKQSKLATVVYLRNGEVTDKRPKEVAAVNLKLGTWEFSGPNEYSPGPFQHTCRIGAVHYMRSRRGGDAPTYVGVYLRTAEDMNLMFRVIEEASHECTASCD